MQTRIGCTTEKYDSEVVITYNFRRTRSLKNFWNFKRMPRLGIIFSKFCGLCKINSASVDTSPISFAVEKSAWEKRG